VLGSTFLTCIPEPVGGRLRIAMPDEARYDQLIEKRRASGLSDAEANELGRIMAEKAGKGEEYTNAQAERSGNVEELEAAEERERQAEDAARQEARGEGEDET
jgi:hypothetical protein